jgi:class 3 adenylate cyclase
MALSVRVGIDSGTVVIGKGSGGESEVFGDTANIAARVQSAADPDMVIVLRPLIRWYPACSWWKSGAVINLRESPNRSSCTESCD